MCSLRGGINILTDFLMISILTSHVSTPHRLAPIYACPVCCARLDRDYLPHIFYSGIGRCHLQGNKARHHMSVLMSGSSCKLCFALEPASALARGNGYSNMTRASVLSASRCLQEAGARASQSHIIRVGGFECRRYYVVRTETGPPQQRVYCTYLTSFRNADVEACCNNVEHDCLSLHVAR